MRIRKPGRRLLTALLGVALGLGVLSAAPVAASEPSQPAAGSAAQSAHSGLSGAPRVILDTDLGRWWDDVVALSMVNALVDQHRVRLLGVMSDVPNVWDAPAIDAIDTYYGHAGIPIGAVGGTAANSYPMAYSRYVAENFPHALASGADAPDAVTLYQQLLERQPDHSVTVVSIGSFTNLAGLLAAPPLPGSRLSGRDLVARKVSRMVVMGGQYPSSPQPETNFAIDPAATARVVDGGWPTPMVFDGFEIGGPVYVGAKLCTTVPPADPARGVYDMLFGCGKPPGDGSWDPTTVYYAMFGTAGVYRLAGRGGQNLVAADGGDTWIGKRPAHPEAYLVLTDAKRLGTGIDALLDYIPGGQR